MHGVRVILMVTVLMAIAGGAVPARAGAGTVNCSDAPYNGTISGTIRGNVEVTAYPSVCQITGVVEGNVTAHNGSAACEMGYPPVTAINVVGGTVRGNAMSDGGDCVMIWLRDGATVEGNVIHRSDGNLGFLGSGPGAQVEGSAILHDGHLFATGGSATNAVAGNLICNGGEPQGSGEGSAIDWDADGDVDGRVANRYIGC